MAYTGPSRKVISLSSGEETRLSVTNAPSVTSRAFFCSVVVESGSSGELGQDLRALVTSLGERISSVDGTVASAELQDSPSGALPDLSSSPQRKRALTNATALSDVLNEFVSTERSYVKRLQILKESYADPLRTFARAKESAILPPYEAKTLFGNIDNILLVNHAFLRDLEHIMRPDGRRVVGGIGDVALKHFKDIRAFDCYKQYYSTRGEAQMILKREKLKKSSTGFATFVDHVKESTSDMRNRVGLSELLMDPVQRIPRYTLLWELMIKYMPPSDPQRVKLIEACQIAQKIAKAEIDDPTKRAAVWYCLERSVEGFPPGLISNGRRFIDCIDVEDTPVELSPSGVSMSTASSASSSSNGTLHCTLFLFDDKLLIVKRPFASASGKSLTGLDQLDRTTKAGGLPVGIKKNGMSYKGGIDITDVVATDVGLTEMHIYLEVPPQDQTDRWSGRPFRALSVVHTPTSSNLDLIQSQNDKHRFLENLWTAQAMYRARQGRSVVLCSAEREVESRYGRVTLARTYFNIYQRTAYLGEPKKGKVVFHIDPSGAADQIPFGINAPPYVVIRAQPMAGDLSRYAVTSSDPDDEEEVDIVHTATIPDRIVQTIHQFGLFKFRTGKNSAPSTPTASTRSRAAIFGLDAISRNLFPGVMGKGGDVFGAVLSNNPKRSRSATSRTSTQTATTMDSAVKFSTRSTSTVATSVLMDEESSHGSPSRKLQRGRKSYSEKSSPSRSRSHSQTREKGNVTHEPESRDRHDMDESEWDLNTRLALARRNSRNQEAKEPLHPLTNPPVEDTIYEEEPPAPAADISKLPSRPATPIFLESISPTKENINSPRKRRTHSADRRPMGPRAPSPLPPQSPDFEAVESTLENLAHAPPATPQRQVPKSSGNLSRIRRPPLEPRANEVMSQANLSTVPSSVEPLTIKKKVSVRSGSGASPPSRNRPTHARTDSMRHTSPQVRGVKRTTSLNDQSKQDLSTQVLVTAQSTREDVDSIRRVVKRIKLEITNLKTSSSKDAVAEDGESEPLAPRSVIPRSPHTRHMSAKSDADARIEEMRQMISMRQAESPFRRQARDDTPQKGAVNYVSDGHRLQEWVATVEGLVGQSERELKRAITNHELLHADLKVLTAELKEKSSEISITRAELQSTKRQFELVKNLLADATTENDILHQAFNEELDGMYNDANLPETDAWTAMTKDIRETKDTRNTLKRENTSLKRKLDEVELQNEEWGALLRAHGLIP